VRELAWRTEANHRTDRLTARLADVLLPDIEWTPKPPMTEDEMFHNLDRIIAQADRRARMEERRRSAHAVRVATVKPKPKRRPRSAPQA
jgi:hypothetical protein